MTTRVFIADDHAGYREGVVRLIGEHPGLIVVGDAADGTDALSAIERLQPDVVLLDLRMPGLDGLQFMRRMRELPPERGGQVPAIAITAYYEDFAAAAALEAGFNAYMIKPIKLEELVRLVREIARSL